MNEDASLERGAVTNYSPSSAVEVQERAFRESRRLSFDRVVYEYKQHGYFISPLLEPVDRIQVKLKLFKLLAYDEILLRFDADTEEFVVATYNPIYLPVAQRKNRSWKQRLRDWLIKKL